MIHEFSKVNAFGMGVAGSLRGKLTSSVRNCGTLWGGYVPIRVNYFWVALSKFISYCSPYLKNGELRTIRAHFRRCNGISKLCPQACMFQFIGKLFCCTVLLYYNLKLWNLHLDSLNITTGVINSIKVKSSVKIWVHSILYLWWGDRGSFAVQSGDHFPSGDHLRFNLGIISGPGIICGSVHLWWRCSKLTRKFKSSLQMSKILVTRNVDWLQLGKTLSTFTCF